jgi:hypothetical protein
MLDHAILENDAVADDRSYSVSDVKKDDVLVEEVKVT